MKKLIKKIANARAKLAVVATSLVATAPAFAADAIDTSGPVGQIGNGLVAVGAIGAAWVGFKYLQKVWNRV